MIEETTLQAAALLYWAPLLAALAFTTGIALLLVATWRAERESRIQIERIRLLEGQLAETLRAQLGLQQTVCDLQQQGSAMRLRQERIEKRAPDGRRIDDAVRLVQHGHAEPGMLRELGLSHGEAALLLRLHQAESARADAREVSEATPQAVSQAAGLAQALCAATPA